MTINELIKELEEIKKQLGGERTIKMASDEEGNTINDIYDVALLQDDEEETEELVIYPR